VTLRKLHWGKIGKLLWMLFCLGSVGLDVVTGYHSSISVLERIRPLQVLEDLGVAIVAIAVGAGSMRLHPCLKWWIGRPFMWLHRRRRKLPPLSVDSPGNFNLAPMRLPVLGPIYAVAFAFILPQVALIEERVFRSGTTSWGNAMVRSLIFAAVHLLVGAPLCWALGIWVAGMWFSYCYFHGDLLAATVHHTTYDLFMMALMAVALFIGRVPLRRHRHIAAHAAR